MINVCIIGAGKISEEYIKVIKVFKNINIAGIVSKSKKSSQLLSKKNHIPVFGNSIDNVMLNVKPDIVIICVTTTATIDVCKKIFKYKCTTLIEKPAGLNIDENKQIIKLAKKYKHKAYIALNRRYFSSTKNLIKKLEKNKSKRIVNIFDQENTETAIKNGHSKVVVKNWMFANSIHLIDLFLVFCRGNVKKIFKQKIKINNNQSYTISIIKFSSGDIGVYSAYWNRPAPWKVTISCNETFFYMAPIEKLFQVDNKKKITEYKTSVIDKKYKPGYYKMIYELIRAHENKKNKLVRLEENSKTMKLINKLYNY